MTTVDVLGNIRALNAGLHQAIASRRVNGAGFRSLTRSSRW